MTAVDVDILIVGAGVAGLATALNASSLGKRVLVLESRAHPGGRIRSARNNDGAWIGDLGPTWIWPAWQPVMARWIAALELETFPQFDTGSCIFDQGPGSTPELCALSAMEGNMRISGGSQAIVDALVARLPDDALATSQTVTRISLDATSVRVATRESITEFTASQVVVALPPRIAVQSIRWSPELGNDLSCTLQNIPTWMAQHAKAVAIYDTAFWRDRGLSGRIMSRGGPLVEVHDHSGPDVTPASLFGFVGWPHDFRSQPDINLEAQVHAQLMRCFGPAAPEPERIEITDWATDQNVTTPADLNEPMSHPSIGPKILREAHWDRRLIFAGAETADQSPGLIEGAFASADAAAFHFHS